jgi:hypothetical protein
MVQLQGTKVTLKKDELKVVGPLAMYVVAQQGLWAEAGGGGRDVQALIVCLDTAEMDAVAECWWLGETNWSEFGYKLRDKVECFVSK